MQKLLLGIGLVVITLAVYGVWQSFGTQNVSPVDDSSTVNAASNFMLKDINGTQISLNQYSGRPILVHFMALAGCTGEVNDISYTRFQQLGIISTQYSGKVTIVTVSVATCAGCDTILAQLRESFDISWILGNDYDDERLDIVQSYSNYSEEQSLYDGTIVLIDKSFNVAQVYNPDATLGMLTSKIDQLL